MMPFMVTKPVEMNLKKHISGYHSQTVQYRTSGAVFCGHFNQFRLVCVQIQICTIKKSLITFSTRNLRKEVNKRMVVGSGFIFLQKKPNTGGLLS